MNTYGTRFRVTTYGESHGPAVGAVIDGCPAGVRLDLEAIDRQLARRRNGAPRQEEDAIEWLSGLKDGITLGTPIAFTIRNRYARPADYDRLEHMFRPGHADYTYYMKYGLRDHRGGGRASARETVARVVAGAIAQQLMPEVQITSDWSDMSGRSDLSDTYGGIVSCRITGLPAGIGEPVFGKLNAALAAAMMSIPSAIGFEMGAGFAAAQMTGSEYIDRWENEELRMKNEELRIKNEELRMKNKELSDASADSSFFTLHSSLKTANSQLTKTNHCGGIQGGISNGMPVEFRVAFHPVVTLPQPVECLHEDGHLESIDVGGRHDRCHVGRATVVVEAMAALCLINYLL